MSTIKNPRFPHTCKIIRFASTSPMVDQSNVDNPLLDEGELLEDSVESNSDIIIYEGICRSDNRNTISDNGDVIASYRTLALPLKQDEWTEDTIPMEGDKIVLQRTGYKEYGTVIERHPSNLGTHLLWKYVRN